MTQAKVESKFDVLSKIGKRNSLHSVEKGQTLNEESINELSKEGKAGDDNSRNRKASQGKKNKFPQKS